MDIQVIHVIRDSVHFSVIVERMRTFLFRIVFIAEVIRIIVVVIIV
jgi:hypothetical protein